MTAQDNLFTIQQAYEAFRKKDLPMILDLQADDTEWSVAGPGNLIPWAAPRFGRDGVADFLKVLADWLVPEVFRIDEYLSQENTVVAIGYQRGLVKPTGNPYEFDFVHVWKLREGKITRFRVYYDTAYLANTLRSEGGKGAGVV